MGWDLSYCKVLKISMHIAEMLVYIGLPTIHCKGVRVRIRVWIREQRKIKRRSKALLCLWWQTWTSLHIVDICSIRDTWLCMTIYLQVAYQRWGWQTVRFHFQHSWRQYIGNSLHCTPWLEWVPVHHLSLLGTNFHHRRDSASACVSSLSH